MSNRQRVTVRRFGYSFVTAYPVLSPAAGKQLNLHSLALINGSGAAISLGLGIGCNTQFASVYSLRVGVAGSQSTTLFTTTANDGFIVQSSLPIDMLALHITQADAGSGVYEYAVWTGAAFQVFTPSVSPTWTATGETALIFPPDFRWTAGNGGFGNLDATRYTLRIRATTPPSQAVIADINQPCRLIAFRESVESKQSIEADFSDNQYLLAGSEAVFPYFGTANAQNAVELVWQVNP